MYIKEDLEGMLRNHLKNEAKLTEIELKQEEYEERLEYAGTVYQDSKEEAIEAGAKQGARTAIDGILFYNEEDIKDIKARRN